MLPEGEDLNEWVAVNTVDFFNQINMLYGTITEFCTEQSCPVMSAGPKYEVCVVTKTSYRVSQKMSLYEMGEDRIFLNTPSFSMDIMKRI